MKLSKQVLSLCEDRTITLWRGVKDVLPSKVNHSLIDEDGVWGSGVYFSKDETVAAWYAFKGADLFGLLMSYKLESSTAILDLFMDVDIVPPHPTEDSVKLLPSGMSKLKTKSKEVPTNTVLQLATKAGFDGVHIDYSKAKSRAVTEDMTVLSPKIKLKPTSIKVNDTTTGKSETFTLSNVKKIETFLQKAMDSYKDFQSDNASSFSGWMEFRK